MRRLTIGLFATSVLATSLLESCAVPINHRPTVDPSRPNLDDKVNADSNDPVMSAASVATAAIRNAGRGKPAVQDLISGTCMLRDNKSKQNLPCSYLMLILTDSTQKEITRANCSENGSFSFLVQQGQHYKILPLSKQFHLSTEREWSAGDTGITLQLE